MLLFLSIFFFQSSHGAFLGERAYDEYIYTNWIQRGWWSVGKDRWVGERFESVGGMPLCKRFEVELVPEWRRQCIDYKVRGLEEKEL